jgi:site-specific DNA recombinase
MKIAALYARVSTTNQQQDETIASQLDALMAYARGHDYEINRHHIYQDEGFSGASVDRPALDALRDAVAAGELEAVLILSPDRLARQFAYQYVVTEEFEQAGCEVVFVSHGLGQTPAERMLREMAGVFAQYERAQIAARCRRGRIYKARQGYVWMSQAPYGYTYVPKTEACPGRLIINEPEAEVVRQLFHWLVDEQLSTSQMTKRINETGWRTRQGNTHWSAGYMRKLLGNAIYRGIYYDNKRKLVQATRRNMPAQGPLQPRRTGRVVRPKQEWIAIEVPAIVGPETWELAQQLLRLNRERSPRNTKKHAYLGGVSNVDIDGNNTLQIKALGVTISTFETLPSPRCSMKSMSSYAPSPNIPRPTSGPAKWSPWDCCMRSKAWATGPSIAG